MTATSLSVPVLGARDSRHRPGPLSDHPRTITSAMRWFGWFRSTVSGDPRRTDGPSMAVDRHAVRDHLKGFATSRRGVEAFVEPATNVTSESIVLVATDGEWTRRRVPNGEAAAAIAREMNIPIYDVQRTGYPQRVRDYNSRQRISQKRANDL